MMRHPQRYPLFSFAAAALVTIGIAGCDQAVYEQSAPAPQPVTATEPQTPPAGSGVTRGGTAYGAAMKAGHRTADRVDDHQQRILEEIPD